MEHTSDILSARSHCPKLGDYFEDVTVDWAHSESITGGDGSRDDTRRSGIVLTGGKHGESGMEFGGHRDECTRERPLCIRDSVFVEPSCESIPPYDR